MAQRDLVVFFDIGETLLDRHDHWIAGAKEALASLRQRGVPLGIISNVGDLGRSELQAELPGDLQLADFDPFVVLSSEVGFAKPARQIFEKAIALADARCVVFCSEDLEHCLAAQRLGMLGLRLNPPVHSDIVTVPQLLDRASLLPVAIP